MDSRVACQLKKYYFRIFWFIVHIQNKFYRNIIIMRKAFSLKVKIRIFSREKFMNLFVYKNWL